MNYDSIVQEVFEALKELSSPERKAQTAYYAPTAMEVLGVSNPGWRGVLKELKATYRDLAPQAWIALSKKLVDTHVFECQVLGFELLAGMKKVLEAMSHGDVLPLMKHLDNWASVDHFSVGIYGVLWRMGTLNDEQLMELLRSENVWERRVAVVSTVALNTRSRGGEGDADRTLMVCQEVVDERHPMIWKALSWALRSLIYWDREAVRCFVESHRERMSRQVLREVEHKLEFGTKN